MRPKVLLTHWIQPEIEAFLRSFADIEMPDREGVMPRHEILDKGRGADALMVCMADLVDGDLLDHCPKVRIVAAAIKGANNIDVEECTRRGIWVTICQDELTAPSAELVVAMMLTLGRRLGESQRAVRVGFAGWRPQWLSLGMKDRTAGLIGMGKLGRAVAKRLRAFDMMIMYHDVESISKSDEYELGVARCGFHDVIAQSDYIVLLVPLTAATRHVIDAETLRRMRRGAFLINCARGSIVDEGAVAEALRSGLLGGYAADVFAMEDLRQEDRPSAIHPGLLDQPDKVMLTPHIGSAVADIRRHISMVTAQQIRDVCEGREPDRAINRIS